MKKLVQLLKKSFEDEDEPLNTHYATKVVRQIYNENGKFLSGLRKEDFLARAKEIVDKDKEVNETFCPLCFRKFIHRKNRDSHVESVHDKIESNKLKCLSCSKSFMSKTSLKYHTDTTHGEGSLIPVKCKICKKEFRHQQVLRRHLKSVHKHLEKGSAKEDIQCEHCGKSFSRRDNLTIHERIVHKLFDVSFVALKTILKYKGGFKCKLCDKEIHGEKAEQEIQDHVLRKCKSDTGGVQCEECGAPFTLQRNLAKHMLIKHKSGPTLFSCTLCDFTSKYENSLSRHKKRKHVDH